MKQNILSKTVPHRIIIIGSLVGGIAAFLQTIERIEWGERPANPLICDISHALACSHVFGAWQSSFFGFSNALLCLTFFTVMLGFSVAVLSSKKTAKTPRLLAHFFSLFFLGFGAWYITQLIYSVGSMCVYCAFCYTGVIAINWGWLRANIDDLPLSTKLIAILKNSFQKGADTFFWVLYGLAFVGMFLFKFYI